MNKWTLKSLAATALGVFALAGQANAAISYSYVTDQANYNGNPGQAVSVKLYLLETLDGGSASLITADGGLTGGAMRITKASGTSTLGTFTYNATDFSGPSNAPGTQTATEVAFLETGALQGAQPALGANGGNAANTKAGAIYLGSVDVLPVDGVTTFNLRSYGPQGNGDTITSTNSYDLDLISNAQPAYSGTGAHLTSFSVTVVPEPTSVGVAMVLGAAGTLIRRRRQQA